MSELELTLAWQMRESEICKEFTWTREWKPFLDRKNKIDFAYLRLKIAIEVEGGTWSGGRHTRGAGFENDCRKYNRLTLEGWRVFRFTADMVNSGEAIQVIEQVLRGETG
jgi:very-short-patch-repair endonuclease